MTESLIAELIAAGEVRKAELVELAGGLYMPSYVAAILKIPEQLVEERRKAGELIAVETGEGYRYPACQFTPDGIVTGLSEVLAVMPIRPTGCGLNGSWSRTMRWKGFPRLRL